MRDKKRDVVWEETHTFTEQRALCSKRQFAEWVTHLHKQPCHVVSTDYRPTPLRYYTFRVGGDAIRLLVDEMGQFQEDNFTELCRAYGICSQGRYKERLARFEYDRSVFVR